MPLLQSIWTQWAPLQEKTRLVCCHSVGVPFGSVFIVRVTHVDKLLYPPIVKEKVINPIKALVGGRLGHVFGWRSLFYFAAACNLICAILFFILVRDTPRNRYQVTHRFTLEY